MMEFNVKKSTSIFMADQMGLNFHMEKELDVSLFISEQFTYL